MARGRGSATSLNKAFEVRGGQVRLTVLARRGPLIARRLSDRRREIEQLTLTRVYGIAEPPGAAELDYLHGLREAVSAAVDFGLEVLSRGVDRPPPLPAALLVQARLAARNGVTLDVVLRRYFSGYALFTSFVFEEMQKVEVQGSTGLLQGNVSQFERLIGAIAEEYQREVAAAVESTPELQAGLVERLLAGEVIDVGPLAYDVHSNWHLAMIFSDHEGAGEALHALAEGLDCRLLHVRPRTGPSWAWLGRRRSFVPAEVQAEIEKAVKRQPIAVGHPARGLAGWRLSHRQARAIHPVVQRRGEVLSYAEAGLVITMAKDDVLVASLHQLYIEPLSCGRDSGEGLKETVRAYLAAGRNISSAASALQVNRQTVRTRLRTVEDKIGRSLDECGAEIEIALRIEQELSGDFSVSNRLFA
jgi:PucR-like helix-turn-helix protein/diguanylate cyclase with GGDEF domain